MNINGMKSLDKKKNNISQTKKPVRLTSSSASNVNLTKKLQLNIK
jgi:hypothetical protein